MGFLKPARGSVSIAGLPVGQALKRGLVAYVPQAEEVDWTFPVLVEDVVMMGRYGHMGFLRIARQADQRRRSMQALARVNMLEYTARARSASCRAGSASASSWRARWRRAGRCILLDEPFTGVDVTDRGCDRRADARVARRRAG